MPDFTQRCLSASEDKGGVAWNATRDGDVAPLQTTPTPLVREWAKAKLTRGSWKDALLSAVHVSMFTLVLITRLTLYVSSSPTREW